MDKPKLDTCMWDLIDSNVELFMYLVKGLGLLHVGLM